jgi:YHS domain-containing protein
MTRVNWEVYFFSDAVAKARFDAESLTYCGLVTDPVTKTRFRPDAGSPTAEYNSRLYYFMNESTATKFREDAERLADPSYSMKQAASE